MLVDLHAYTTLSGGATLRDLVADAKANGLDAICIADREASAETARAVVDGDFALPVLVGVEIGTRAGDAIVFVKDLDPIMTREEWRELNALERPDLSEVIEWARERGGVVILAHPYDRSRRLAPRDRMFVASKVDGVELGSDDAEPRSNRIALEAVGKSTLAGCGGSARSSKSGKGDGAWLTLFASPVSDQATLVDAIASGDFWAVQVDRTAASGNQSSGDRGPRRSDNKGGGRKDGGRRRSGGRRR